MADMNKIYTDAVNIVMNIILADRDQALIAFLVDWNKACNYIMGIAETYKNDEAFIERLLNFLHRTRIEIFETNPKNYFKDV